jgi:hypothetical protein
VAEVSTWPDPDPPPKVFKPKFSLPPIADYKVGADASFWEKFPSRKSMHAESLVCPVKLRQLAARVDCANHPMLEIVCKDLTEGADIGCIGSARSPSVSTNAHSTSGQKSPTPSPIGSHRASRRVLSHQPTGRKMQKSAGSCVGKNRTVQHELYSTSHHQPAIASTTVSTAKCSQLPCPPPTAGWAPLKKPAGSLSS